MFRVTLTHLILIYMAVLLGILCCAWVIGEFIRFRQDRRQRRSTVVCDICGHSFEDLSEVELLTCPSCGRLNERGSVREI
jgi:protein-arginine kinase activator protein McsA